MQNNQVATIAQNTLLLPTGLDEAILQKLLNQLLSGGVDDGDLYFQYQARESWILEDHQIKTGTYNLSQGVGVRALSNEKAGLAYTNTLDKENLLQAIKMARNVALHGGENERKVPCPIASAAPLVIKHHVDLLYSSNNPLLITDSAIKVAWLKNIDSMAHALDPRVKKVKASLQGSYTIVLILNNLGQLVYDVRPLVRFSVNVLMEEKGRTESGTGSGGGRIDYAALMSDDGMTRFVQRAVHEAALNLRAEPAPAGTMPVVLGPGWSGVLLHEAVGHGLEGDFNRKGLSAYSGKLGQQVASSAVTIVDNGAIPERRGSLSVDDEGTPTQCTTLIENGVLKNYMQDRLNARLMGLNPTGNGRRESFAHLPMPRMTNTYMLAGEYLPTDIISSVKKGLYAANLDGGQVDITSGQFVFATSEAYLIENGKITRPVKGATLIGNGPEAMKRVSMVGNDLALDPGVGTCGKNGQSVPVGVGQPTVKVDSLVVGGTK